MDRDPNPGECIVLLFARNMDVDPVPVRLAARCGWQSWMFAPLTDYHAGGAAAALEPFAENIDAWEWTLGTFLGHGRGACYRGDQLFDTPTVQAMVSKWTRCVSKTPASAR